MEHHSIKIHLTNETDSNGPVMIEGTWSAFSAPRIASIGDLWEKMFVSESPAKSTQLPHSILEKETSFALRRKSGIAIGDLVDQPRYVRARPALSVRTTSFLSIFAPLERLPWARRA